MWTFHRAYLSVASLLFVGVLALAGCASSNPVPPVESETADMIVFRSVSDPDPSSDFTMNPTWEKTSDGKVLVSLYGSSSCEPTIVEATYKSQGVVLLTLDSYENVACTADLGGPFMWELSNLPSEVTRIEICSDTSKSCSFLPEKL